LERANRLLGKAFAREAGADSNRNLSRNRLFPVSVIGIPSSLRLRWKGAVFSPQRPSLPRFQHLQLAKRDACQVVSPDSLRRHSERLWSSFHYLDVEAKSAACAAAESDESAAVSVELLDLRG